MVQSSNELFATQRDAALHLIGLFGFWGGFAATWFAVAIDSPPAILLFALVMIGGAVAVMRASRTLSERMTGHRVRPWPLGYPTFRAQFATTLPSTVTAAARKLNLNPPLVVATVYGLLAADIVAFVVLLAR